MIMNIKKFFLAVVSLSMLFTAETFAKTRAKPMPGEERQRILTKERPVKIQKKNRALTRKKHLQKPSKKHNARIKKSRSVARRTAATPLKRSRITRKATAKRHRSPLVNERKVVKKQIQKRQVNKPAQVKENDRRTIKQPVHRRHISKPRPAQEIVDLMREATFMVPEQNGQWQATYEMKDGTIARRTLQGIQYGPFSSGRNLCLRGNIIINGKPLTNDLTLSMDQNQVTFIKELDKQGGIRRVVPLH